MTEKKRVGVLISGRGSNLASLIAAAAAPDYPAEIAIVISNKADASGLSHADRGGIPKQAISHKDYRSREAYDAALTSILKNAGVEIVCNAGFMRLHSAAFVREWRGRQINIHPSLLPSFRGLNPQLQALKAGVRVSGCTVHFVSEEMDAGPIIAQAAVPVMLSDKEESLSARILQAEHTLYPLALNFVASGQALFDGGRTVFRDPSAQPFLLSTQF